MDNKEKNFISAVVYVHNLEKEIGNFLNMLIGVLDEMFEHSEIILVNDASNDASMDIIRSMSASSRTCSISIVHMSSFHGVEMAISAGTDLAIGDMIFEFESTHVDYSPEMIKKAYYSMLEGYDLVSVSPEGGNGMSSRLFYKVFAKYSNMQMNTERFRLLSRRIVNRVAMTNTVVSYRKVAYQSAGFRSLRLCYKSEKCKARKRERIESRYRANLAVDSLILFTEVGYRISKAMTVTMMLISLFMVVYSVVIYFAAKPIEGWTTTVLFLSVAFFGLFAVLTVIVRYLQLLVNLLFKRKHYLFESVEKLS